MTRHTCLRCGLESRCSYDSWPDRHPVAAVFFALSLALIGLAAIAENPWLFVPLLVVAMLAVVIDREHRRRAALAARADYDHQVLMWRSLGQPPAPMRPQPLWSANPMPYPPPPR
jgi:hypothetical protein